MFTLLILSFHKNTVVSAIVSMCVYVCVCVNQHLCVSSFHFLLFYHDNHDKLSHSGDEMLKPLQSVPFSFKFKSTIVEKGTQCPKKL